MPRRRYAARVHKPFAPPVAEPQGHRELVAVREIVHAFVRADRPDDVYQFALDRISPVVGASFASVHLTDGASEAMRLVAAYNWPERQRPWLVEIRTRVGVGPGGEAASERRVIEIPDVFADPDLDDWHEVARELGFRALVALPLQTADRVLGAVCFYFSDLGGFTGEKRVLLHVVADQMTATAEKAARIDEMRRTDAALVEANAELERQYVAVVQARLAKDEFLANVSDDLWSPLATVTSYLARLRQRESASQQAEESGDLAGAHSACERLLGLIDGLLEFAAIRRGTLELRIEEFDPRVPLRDAMQATKGVPDSVQLIAQEPAHAMPMLLSDRGRITRMLVTLLSNAFRFTAAGEVRASVNVVNGRVEYRVQDSGIGIEPAAQLLLFDEFRQQDDKSTRYQGNSGLGLALSRALARQLGGDIGLVSASGQGSTFTLNLPLVCDSSPISPDS